MTTIKIRSGLLFYFPLWIISFTILSLNGCKNSAEKSQTALKQGSITITGAFALYPMMEVWAAVYQEENPGVRIFLFPASSTKGNLAVINDQADIGMFSKNTGSIQNRQLLRVYAVAQDAVLVTINSENPWKETLLQKGIKLRTLKEIYLEDKCHSWSGITEIEPSKPIFVLTRSDLCGAGQVFAEFLNTSQENLLGLGIYGDLGMIRTIEKQVFAIGFDNLRYVYNNSTGKFYVGIAALPIDFNENGNIDPEEDFYQNQKNMTDAIKNGTYPYPLSRKLCLLLPAHLISPTSQEFVSWILSEGQKYVEKSGYVKIDNPGEISPTSDTEIK